MAGKKTRAKKVPEPAPDVDMPEPVPDVDMPEPVPDVNMPEPVPDVDMPEPVPDVNMPDPVPEMDMPEPIPVQDAGFPIVGIGASAGGLAAFEAFFSGMQADKDPGMAFVLVQHLAPDHKSILTELIRRYTRMDVFEVEDGMVVKPNCTYIIPPNFDMAFFNGVLHLLEPSAPRGQRLPIDFFFRSLAQDQHERAICIVLSGTGSDGSLGVRAIKGEGGLVMVQNPASTEYDGMPHSAIGTGLADYVLPPAEMPAQLMAYAAHAFSRPLNPNIALTAKSVNTLGRIFILLRAQTGHDFSQYKVSTIHRRIERRMGVHQISTMDGYARYLQKNPAEVDALFRDLLIGVTNFFRDEEAFKALEEQAIPKLFANKAARATIRVWSAGCSTGEEAYSLAILLQERLDELRQGFKAQVFATDIDGRAIATARLGRYPASIAADISPERLARFFTMESDGNSYRIHKNIRDLIVFSEQDVIKDPPFSKLDLISCRNLMIYMGGDLQKKLIPLFHYSLNPGGVLFLGTSEGIGDFDLLFSGLNRIMKLYARREENGIMTLPDPVRRTRSEADAAAVPPQAIERRLRKSKPSLRERTEQALLHQMNLAGALVNGKGDILYLHGRTGMYLEPAQGVVGTPNILKMAREGLQENLAITLHKVEGIRETVCSPNLRVKTNGHYTRVNLTICPVEADPDSQEGLLYLVAMEEAAFASPGETHSDTPDPGVRPDETDVGSDPRIHALTRELLAKEEYLHAANEELATSNEEFKSSNEEMQSVNEELQSTNEELETAKEELQSVNEELSTVNSELLSKVSDLSRINNDMNNLLAGTGIGTIFVDFQLRIMRFTPAAAQFINLILSDVGRPVAHIVSNLVNYDRMVQDTKTVLDTLIPLAVEVRTLAGNWCLMRIQPYRTTENVIEGAVISFIDISEIVQAREALRKSNEVLRLGWWCGIRTMPSPCRISMAASWHGTRRPCACTDGARRKRCS